MSATIEQLTKWRDDLVENRARGVKSVSYDGKQVTYKDDAEMQRAIDDLERRIAAASGKPRPRGAYAGFSRGH